MTLSVIVPTYNERESLPELIRRLQGVARGLPLELVVVDDASPDGTGAMAEQYARSGVLPMVVVHRESKAGLASAVLDGARAARGDVVSVMDADLSHPPEMLVDLAAQIRGGADIVVASRYIPGGGIEAWPLLRRVVSRVATALARAVLGLPVRDPLSGFFAARRALLVEGRYLARGYKLLVEVLATHPEARVVEVPYRFADRLRGSSKLSAGEILDYLRLLLALRTRRSRWNSARC
ncbi:MAG: polyprenol monophosphomannose synthase [Armatimonadota bacterium]|nr:polyprenol monophosphomannose synthase [Armatimonadota bacterium]MDR7451348.1 polyprenol monophosphomannose synthase [Armatimonadota bacterium]MDR7466502.1 polyprenol monophosphomannose synthase [Armatimonadota bacterium]MDR7493224.1 polyprenol monophosphomannose synthase [Armatimonadota bacterium]MDR7499423.1 polyprenol monophosphomannose synthase [Armatimonadota bacterium]